MKFRINEVFKKDSIKSRWYLKWFEDETNDGKEVLRQYRNFRATCSPAFLIAKFKINNDSNKERKFDFFSKAFECVFICQEHMKNFEEYQNQFEQMETSIGQFLVHILDFCDQIDEAKLLLMNDFENGGIYHTRYPRIETAIKLRQEEFAGNDFCQQILREDWLKSKSTGNIIQWQVSNLLDILLYCISSIIFLPLHVIGCVWVHLRHRCKGETPEVEERRGHCSSNTLREMAHFLTYPINRFIINCSVLVFYIILLFVTGIQMQDERHGTESKTTWLELCCESYIFLTSIGFLLNELKARKIGVGFIWKIFNSIGLAVVLVSLGIEFCRKYFGIIPNENWKEIGFCLYALGITMIILRLSNFLLLARNLGPIAISIISVFYDIFFILLYYISILLGFGFGIHNIMKSVKNDGVKEDCKHQVGKIYFRSFFEIFFSSSACN